MIAIIEKTNTLIMICMSIICSFLPEFIQFSVGQIFFFKEGTLTTYNLRSSDNCFI